MLKSADIFVTGGAGTLGRAIARRRKEAGWTGKLTVYSTDNHKHQIMRVDHPDVQYVQGDIRNHETLYNAMVGHDVVIHAAAVKVIPESEYWSIDTFDVNVVGSMNVFQCAVRADILDVLAISTDKACHPANAYGASKLMMEKIAQEYARVDGMATKFHLVRYGNVLESNGSVVEAWKKAVAAGEPIKITDPDMTRFWLSPSQAVDYVIEALGFESGQIFVPSMPAMSIGKLAEYTVGHLFETGDDPVERIPLRPGEKMHETLVTLEELSHAYWSSNGGTFPFHYVIYPTTDQGGLRDRFEKPYSSDMAREVTKKEFLELLDD